MSDNPDNLDELNKWFIIWPTKKVLNVTVSRRFLTLKSGADSTENVPTSVSRQQIIWTWTASIFFTSSTF